ncbi:hypothetical protein J6590_038678 [Homalodisca vitripennis]|nr:hypothetical protein J6590_038678 [Homalodisca vitripennis]
MATVNTTVKVVRSGPLDRVIAIGLDYTMRADRLIELNKGELAPINPHEVPPRSQGLIFNFSQDTDIRPGV